jgi:hypothetical protein
MLPGSPSGFSSFFAMQHTALRRECKLLRTSIRAIAVVLQLTKQVFELQASAQKVRIENGELQ